ncbi:hypothetical protein SCATT_p10410 (plasmid) [Streptantibioticus cattleyicolor NRRL 8057 = DSM 46488]|uniref:Uncharacterized protein n=1 Tax=Streptantibioticus cattleyicolor (strain ATCC 35852 / DSM 46488 / JCM 4925 / NBRC 14057 / NRRL 8057) TaxID=1003195 RepID=G8XE80_STREN|nr:hypothetical protein SCATT_p10410 [Streptantibioticus cattleyicolor NRRL 8057 = DSM 46488]
MCLLSDPVTEADIAAAHAAGRHIHLLADGRETCLYDDPGCAAEPDPAGPPHRTPART